MHISYLKYFSDATDATAPIESRKQIDMEIKKTFSLIEGGMTVRVRCLLRLMGVNHVFRIKTHEVAREATRSLSVKGFAGGPRT